MEKIPLSTITEIQKKANIVDIISKYLQLEKKGKNYFALCPFHDDHNPSFCVSEEKQIYTCFVCSKSGNVFNFVMNYENTSFLNAVSIVAKDVGFDINIDTSVKEKKITHFDKYYKIYDILNKYYKNNIRSKAAEKANLYLNSRNINEEIIKEFEIGLSLNDNKANELLIKKGYSLSDLIMLGICDNKNNFTYDYFRNRIMFPLSDTEGNVIGFSGRIYNNENESKYINSKESVIFKKGMLLYNYKRATSYAKEKNSIIITEGFMDVIRLYSIGIKNVIATMGTAITSEHVNLIRKLSNNIILLFDGDKAGEKATISCIELLEKKQLNCKVIRLEDNLDPDEYILKKGPDKFLNHLNNPMSKLDFKMKISKEKTDFNDFIEVSNYVKSMAKELEKIDDKVVFELFLDKISKQTMLDKQTILSYVNKTSKSKIIIERPKRIYKNKYESAEEYLIYYMLRSKDAILLYEKKTPYLINDILNVIANKILDFYDKKGYINVLDFTLFLKDDENLINEVLKLDMLDLKKEVSNEVILDYINTINDGILKNEIEKIKNEIKTETDITKKTDLLNRLTVLKQKECK